MVSMLDEIATAADEAAADQQEVAQRLRRMQRERDRGRSWTAILDRDGSPGVAHLLRGAAARVTRAAVALSVALARGLSGEGESRRRIARRLGVTHQRVSALLNGGQSTAAPADGPS